MAIQIKEQEIDALERMCNITFDYRLKDQLEGNERMDEDVKQLEEDYHTAMNCINLLRKQAFGVEGK